MVDFTNYIHNGTYENEISLSYIFRVLNNELIKKKLGFMHGPKCKL